MNPNKNKKISTRKLLIFLGAYVILCLFTYTSTKYKEIIFKKIAQTKDAFFSQDVNTYNNKPIIEGNNFDFLSDRGSSKSVASTGESNKNKTTGSYQQLSISAPSSVYQQDKGGYTGVIMSDESATTSKQYNSQKNDDKSSDVDLSNVSNTGLLATVSQQNISSTNEPFQTTNTQQTVVQERAGGIPPPDDPIPVGDGIWVFVALGISYAWYKKHQHTKKEIC